MVMVSARRRGLDDADWVRRRKSPFKSFLECLFELALFGGFAAFWRGAGSCHHGLHVGRRRAMLQTAQEC